MTNPTGEPFRQSIPALSLPVERGTPSVPDDGRFHVVLDGVLILSTNSKSEALRAYRSERDRVIPQQPMRATVNVKTLLEKEAAERQVRSFLAESARSKRAKALKKGGKGGSGGVSG